jgi:hypothetical protein
MNRLRTHLRANHARLAFPFTVGVLRELLPDLRAAAPDWLTIAETIEAVEPDGSHPPGFVWNRQAVLRPDEGDEHEHVTTAERFISGFSAWLLDVALPGNPNGLGRHQHGLVLLETAELVRLLPRLFSTGAPALWVRTWPNLQEAAIDFDHMDPCCDGMSGYFVELFRGGLADAPPTLPRPQNRTQDIV